MKISFMLEIMQHIYDAKTNMETDSHAPVVQVNVINFASPSNALFVPLPGQVSVTFTPKLCKQFCRFSF